MSAQQDTDSDLVAQLLRAAGRREEPPADAYRQTLEAATLAWRRKVHGRMRRRRISWAAAASVAVAVTAGLIVDSEWWRFSRQAVARVERVIGAAQMRGARDPRWVTVDDRSPALIEGASFRTDARGRAGVLLSGGASLRLSERTEILLASPTHVRLIAGRVYLDNARSSDGSGIEIETPAGIARDVGTQFEVRYVDARYRLRVREGRVHVRRGAIAIESAAGDEVSIDAAGTVTRERIARDDGEWRWVETLAPAPDLEGQPVSALLAWVARETGRVVRFEPPEIEQKARTTILHGDVRTLAPLEALAVMLETTDLAYTMLEDGTIVIRSRGAG